MSTSCTSMRYGDGSIKILHYADTGVYEVEVFSASIQIVVPLLEHELIELSKNIAQALKK